MELLEPEHFVIDARASKGPADVVALAPGVKLLIQVKSGKGSTYAGFGPKDRAKLKAAARKAGGTAVLHRWYPYARRPEVAPESEWPD